MMSHMDRENTISDAKEDVEEEDEEIIITLCHLIERVECIFYSVSIGGWFPPPHPRRTMKKKMDMLARRTAEAGVRQHCTVKSQAERVKKTFIGSHHNSRSRAVAGIKAPSSPSSSVVIAAEQSSSGRTCVVVDEESEWLVVVG